MLEAVQIDGGPRPLCVFGPCCDLVLSFELVDLVDRGFGL